MSPPLSPWQASPARRKPQPVALAEHRDARRIDLEPVLRRDRRHGLAGRRLHEVGQLLEVALEPAGRDDLEDPAGLVARVPEGVPLTARLEHEVARPGHDDLAAEVRAHPALEHERVLVLAAVAVQRRRQRARRDRVLDEREAAAGLRRPRHEPDAEAAEVARLAVAGADDLRAHVLVSSRSKRTGESPTYRTRATAPRRGKLRV